jgi:hypothetical protein
MARPSGLPGHGGSTAPESDHSGLGKLLPGRSGQRGFPLPRRLDVATRVSMGEAYSPKETLVLAQCPVLGPPYTPRRPMGVWKQANRRLPVEVQLVPNRAARAGQGPGIEGWRRRPRPSSQEKVGRPDARTACVRCAGSPSLTERSSTTHTSYTQLPEGLGVPLLPSRFDTVLAISTFSAWVLWNVKFVTCLSRMR